MPARIQFEKSDNISKDRMDWLGAHGNTWAPVKVMPGTCEACTFGPRYDHTCGQEKECGWCYSTGHTLDECTFEGLAAVEQHAFVGNGGHPWFEGSAGLCKKCGGGKYSGAHHS